MLSELPLEFYHLQPWMRKLGQICNPHLAHLMTLEVIEPAARARARELRAICGIVYDEGTAEAPLK